MKKEEIEKLIHLSDEELEIKANEIKERLKVRTEKCNLQIHLWELVKAVGRLLDDKYSEGDEAVRNELWSKMHRTADKAREYLHQLKAELLIQTMDKNKILNV